MHALAVVGLAFDPLPSTLSATRNGILRRTVCPRACVRAGRLLESTDSLSRVTLFSTALSPPPRCWPCYRYTAVAAPIPVRRALLLRRGGLTRRRCRLQHLASPPGTVESRGQLHRAHLLLARACQRSAPSGRLVALPALLKASAPRCGSYADRTHPRPRQARPPRPMRTQKRRRRPTGSCGPLSGERAWRGRRHVPVREGVVHPPCTGSTAPATTADAAARTAAAAHVHACG